MKIGNYKNLEIGKNEAIEVTEEELNKELAKLLESKGAFETKQGKSEKGDTVNIDYKGLLDGVAFEGGTAEKYDLELGSNSFIPGFEDQLIGYEAGADVDVNVTFPEQYHAENLAGKAVVFKCHIHEVKTKKEPVLDDAFAQGFGLPTADALKSELKRQMTAKKQNDSDNEYLTRLMKVILANSEVEVPEDVMKARVDEMYDYYEGQVAQYGMEMSSYLQMQNMSVEEFRNSLATQAMESAQGDIVFDEIAKAEGIDTTEDEVAHELKMYQDYYQIPDEEFGKFKEEHHDDVYKDIVRRKTALFLIENNK